MKNLLLTFSLTLTLLLAGCQGLTTETGRIDWAKAVADVELIQKDFEVASQIVQEDPELSADLLRISVSIRQVVDAMIEVRDGGSMTTLEDSLQLLESLVIDQLEKTEDPKIILGLYLVARSIDRLRLGMTAVE